MIPSIGGVHFEVSTFVWRTPSFMVLIQGCRSEERSRDFRTRLQPRPMRLNRSDRLVGRRHRALWQGCRDGHKTQSTIRNFGVAAGKRESPDRAALPTFAFFCPARHQPVFTRPRPGCWGHDRVCADVGKRGSRLEDQG